MTGTHTADWTTPYTAFNPKITLDNQQIKHLHIIHRFITSVVLTFCCIPPYWCVMLVRAFFFLASSSCFFLCSSSSLLSFSSCKWSIELFFHKWVFIHFIWRVSQMWLAGGGVTHLQTRLSFLFFLCPDPVLFRSLSTALILHSVPLIMSTTILLIVERSGQGLVAYLQSCWPEQWALPHPYSSGWSEPRSGTAVLKNPFPDASCECPTHTHTHIF